MKSASLNSVTEYVEKAFGISRATWPAKPAQAQAKARTEAEEPVSLQSQEHLDR